MTGLVGKRSCTFCVQPVSFSEKYVVDLEGNSTQFLPARLKLVYNSLGSGFAGLQTTLVNLGLEAFHSRTCSSYCDFLYRQVELFLPRRWKDFILSLACTVHRTDDGFLKVAVSYDGSVEEF